MKRILALSITLAAISIATNSYATALNSDSYYFDKKCLEEVSISTLPRRLEFSCNDNGQCFASDMFLNIVLNCAHKIDNTYVQALSIKPFLLDTTGFRMAQNVEYS